jgi:hypothetical protein
MLVVLQQRGLDHERGYVDALRADGLEVTDLSNNSGEDAIERSLNAMRTGVDIIVQPALRDNNWFGRPDVLRRHEMHSSFGAWSYQVIDTKLAKETRGGTILQLSGPVDSTELNEEAEVCGIALRTLKRAKADLGIAATQKSGMHAGWQCELPPTANGGTR